MQVTQEPLEQCQVALTIEVEEDKVVHAVDQAYREYARYVSVPGFRKGKAPMHFVRQRVSSVEVKQRTAELLVDAAYREALEETKITPYAQPELEVLQLELGSKPFIFKAVVPLAPQVVLGEYKGVSATRTSYEVPDAFLDEEIERTRSRFIEYPEVDRPAESDDLVLADIVPIADGEPDESNSSVKVVRMGDDNSGFGDQIVGMVVDETKSVTVTHPDSYDVESLRGLSAEYRVTVKSIRKLTLPEVNDSLAARATKDAASTVEEWRNLMRAEAAQVVSRRSREEMESQVIDAVLEKSTVAFPPVLLEAELQDDLKAFEARLKQAGLTMDEYALRQETTPEALMETLRGRAAIRLKTGLVLGEIAKTEQLELTEDDVNEALAVQAAEDDTTPAALRAMLESRGTMDTVRNRLETQKVIDFLCNAASITDITASATDPSTLAEDDDESHGDAVVDDTKASE